MDVDIGMNAYTLYRDAATVDLGMNVDAEDFDGGYRGCTVCRSRGWM